MSSCDLMGGPGFMVAGLVYAAICKATDDFKAFLAAPLGLVKIRCTIDCIEAFRTTGLRLLSSEKGWVSKDELYSALHKQGISTVPYDTSDSNSIAGHCIKHGPFSGEGKTLTEAVSDLKRKMSNTRP